MSTTELRLAAVEPSPGMHLGRLNSLLDFLAGKLAEADYQTAENLLLAAISPAAAARLNAAA